MKIQHWQQKDRAHQNEEGALISRLKRLDTKLMPSAMGRFQRSNSRWELEECIMPLVSSVHFNPKSRGWGRNRMDRDESGEAIRVSDRGWPESCQREPTKWKYGTWKHERGICFPGDEGGSPPATLTRSPERSVGRDRSGLKPATTKIYETAICAGQIQILSLWFSYLSAHRLI